uniref:Cyclin-like domain-containing protein n=1 Tax=Eutreptiella gymnastica TaxID=73025 RepID=A0A7S1HWM4_9EUGL|mmetsp:Transcript_110945/g.192326  ORF Transcript_110945/g.192326 Transcript_110945/m.192326 type:complete len:271 (+) Transcript_110945:69-881(+)
MAGDFWASSHYKHWLFAPQYPSRCLSSLPEGQLFTEEEYQLLHFHYAHSIIRLAKTLKLRFRVAATACVYFKRFYLLQSMVSECDPELMVPTTLVLASKVENMHDVNGELVVREYTARHFAYGVEQVMEAEYFLLQALTFHLVVCHPFHPMEKLLDNCAIHGLKVGHLAPTAWAMLNDSYYSGVILVYPPSKIALACLVVAAMLTNIDISDWLSTLDRDHLGSLEAISKDVTNSYHLRAATTSAEFERLADVLHKHIVDRRVAHSLALRQ